MECTSMYSHLDNYGINECMYFEGNNMKFTNEMQNKFQLVRYGKK